MVKKTQDKSFNTITVKQDKVKATNATKSKPVEPVISSAPQKYFLYAVEWQESEAGWGVRGDGWTFHRSAEDALAFIKEFWSKQPKQVPREYTRNVNDKAIILEVSSSLHDYVTQKGNVWLYHNNEKAYLTFDASTLKK